MWLESKKALAETMGRAALENHLISDISNPLHQKIHEIRSKIVKDFLSGAGYT